MHWVISNGKAKMHAVLAERIKYIVKGHGTVGHGCSREGGQNNARLSRAEPDGAGRSRVLG